MTVSAARGINGPLFEKLGERMGWHNPNTAKKFRLGCNIAGAMQPTGKARM